VNVAARSVQVQVMASAKGRKRRLPFMLISRNAVAGGKHECEAKQGRHLATSAHFVSLIS
jgi:hypothetical protein